WELDENLKLTFVQNLTGVASPLDTPSALGTTPWQAAAADAADDAPWQDQRQVLLSRKPFRDFRCSHTRDDGVTSHWSLSGTPVFDKSGVFRGYRGSAAEVTAEADARQRADRAEARLAEAIENFSEGFVL